MNTRSVARIGLAALFRDNDGDRIRSDGGGELLPEVEAAFKQGAVAFEKKYPVCVAWEDRGFNEPPHLDLGLDDSDGARAGV